MSEDSRAQAPDPRTGQEGDNDQHQTDADGIQQQTDEDRLLQETENDTVDDLHSRAMIRLVSSQKKVGQLEFKYQNLVEKKRLSRALSIFEEEHGVLYSEPCLLCLDNIHVNVEDDLTEAFICCGGFICRTCARDCEESGVGFGKCPLCRGSLAETTDAEYVAKLMALAKRGVAWAQMAVSKCMINGIGGFKKQEKSGLEWVNKAVTQNYPPALYLLSDKYRFGLASVLRKSQAKANELLVKSANLGYGPANVFLSNMHFQGTDGFEKDKDEAYYRASGAMALDGSDKAAAMLLGLWHQFPYEGIITEPSDYLACYYLNHVAATEDHGGMYSYLYCQSLQTLNKHLHNGPLSIPGFDMVPALFFWMRRSRDLGYSHALNQLKKWESLGQSLCANCSKEAQNGEKFKQCSKCRAHWYCSKECQVEAWGAGHKKDCKRARVIKFEDYLNAE